MSAIVTQQQLLRFPMEQQGVHVVRHFTDVATRYDDLYGFTYDYLPEFAIKHLQLKPDDVLADIGGGTGAISSLIWKKAGLNHPVVCVDPSTEMLQLAKSRDGLKPFLTTADDFLATTNGSKPKCNKILINDSAHLFPDLQSTFLKAYEYLPVGGLLVVVVRATQSTFPMWRALQEKFAPVSVDKFQVCLGKTDFNVRTSTEVGTVKMTKLDWYDRLRKRIFSTLYEFSDKQIEEGLVELDQEWFSGKEESDLVEIRDSLLFFIATKKINEQ